MHEVCSGRTVPCTRASDAGREFYITQTMSGLTSYQQQYPEHSIRKTTDHHTKSIEMGGATNPCRDICSLIQAVYTLALPNMKVSIILSILGFASIALSANCGSTPGFANGECVFVESGSCGSTVQTSYKPTCAGNCYVYPFNSLAVAGDGVFGTNCQAFSDYNCQNYIGETGNAVSSTCKNFPGGHSMKCYYRC